MTHFPLIIVILLFLRADSAIIGRVGVRDDSILSLMLLIERHVCSKIEAGRQTNLLNSVCQIPPEKVRFTISFFYFECSARYLTTISDG